jgi:hypothetical protein
MSRNVHWTLANIGLDEIVVVSIIIIIHHPRVQLESRLINGLKKVEVEVKGEAKGGKLSLNKFICFRQKDHCYVRTTLAKLGETGALSGLFLRSRWSPVH